MKLLPGLAAAVLQVHGTEIHARSSVSCSTFPVRVNGALLREFLCDVFGGPFPSEEEKLGHRSSLGVTSRPGRDR